jgi:hypothetical protein
VVRGAEHDQVEVLIHGYIGEAVGGGVGEKVSGLDRASGKLLERLGEKACRLWRFLVLGPARPIPIFPTGGITSTSRNSPPGSASTAARATASRPPSLPS